MKRLGRLSAGAALLSVALSACGADRVSGPGTTVADNQTPPPDEHGVVSSCQDLLDAGWVAPESEPNINYDPATGIAEVHLDAREPLLLDLANDEMCAFLPDIGGILSRVLPDYEAARLQECAEAVQAVVSGVVPRKGDIVVDIDDLRAHILEWCPPSFGDRMRQLVDAKAHE